MSVSTANYPSPVVVNGFSCKNCTDVDYAKKHIDPAHPKSGPYGVDAADDPSNTKAPVTFGGSLSSLNANSTAISQSSSDPTKTGSQLDLSA